MKLDPFIQATLAIFVFVGIPAFLIGLWFKKQERKRREMKEREEYHPHYMDDDFDDYDREDA